MDSIIQSSEDIMTTQRNTRDRNLYILAYSLRCKSIFRVYKYLEQPTAPRRAT